LAALTNPLDMLLPCFGIIQTDFPSPASWLYGRTDWFH